MEPKTIPLKKSMLWHMHPKEAQSLHDQGFRCTVAENLPDGSIVAARQDFGGFAFGDTFTTKVRIVDTEHPYEVRFLCDNGDYVEMDEGDQVWFIHTNDEQEN